MIASERLYPIRRPFAAVGAGAAVAILGGLIGLGGAEFRLAFLLTTFAVYPHRAVRINLLISLVALAMSALSRLSLLHTANIVDHWPEVCGMVMGGIVAAWLGAFYLSRIPKGRIVGIIAALLLAIAGLLALETIVTGAAWMVLAHGSGWRWPIAIVAGLAVGTVSSLLGVAGGEFIIPILIFIFGIDIKTAGTASVLISIPIVCTGVARHWLTGHYRSQSMLAYLVVPMCGGSLIGAMIGGYLATWAPTDALRLVLAGLLALSAFKLWSKSPET